MATNQIKTRILSKYDLLENYKDFIPLPGEICIAIVGETKITKEEADGSSITDSIPVVGLKVGDGIHSFTNLTWIQAIAGDVPKFIKEIVDFDDLINEINSVGVFATKSELNAIDANLNSLNATVNEGDNSNQKLRESINEIIGSDADSSETYSLYGIKKYTEEKISDLNTDLSNEISNLSSKVTTNEGNIASLDEKIGSEKIGENDSTTITGAIKALQETVGASGDNSLGSQVTQLTSDVSDIKQTLSGYNSEDTVSKAIEATDNKIEETKNTLTDSISQVAEKAEADTASVNEIASQNTIKIERLIGSDVDESAREIAIKVLAEQLIPENAQDSLDTLKEIADWIQKHPEDVTALNTAIEENKRVLNYINVGTESEIVPQSVDERINSAISDLDIESYAKAADQASIAARVKVIEDAPYATSEEVNLAKEYAISTASSDATSKADTAKITAIETATVVAGDKAEEALKNAEEQITLLKETEIKTNYDSIQSLNTQIDQMDAFFDEKRDSEGLLSGGIMTSLTQENGKITNVTQRKLKMVDFDETDTFIFYCGTANDD